MFERKKLRRERMEIYLVHLILAYRRWLQIGGLLLLAYAGLILFTNLLAGVVLLLPAVYLLLLGGSYSLVVHTARLGAWIGTLWRRDD